jgi:hypothetical protein
MPALAAAARSEVARKAVEWWWKVVSLAAQFHCLVHWCGSAWVLERVVVRCWRLPFQALEEHLELLVECGLEIDALKADMVGKPEADFRVAVKGLAGFAAELAVKRRLAVDGNGVVRVAGSGLGMLGAAEVFVLHPADILAGVAAGVGDEIRLSQRGHGRTGGGRWQAG